MTESRFHKYHVPGKEIAWTVITVGCSIFFAAVLAQVFRTPITDATASTVVFIGRIVLPIIMFSAFLGAFAIHAMIISRPVYRYIVSACSTAVLFLFFTPTLWALLGGVLMFATLLAYHATVQGDVRSRITVQPIYSVAAGLGTVVLALLAVVSLFYYSSFVTRPYALSDLRDDIRDSIVVTTLSFVESRTEGFERDLTLDQVIANFLAGRLEAEIIPQLELKLDEESANDESIQSLKQQLDAQAGLEGLDEAERAQNESKQEIVDVVTDQLGEAEQQLIQQVRQELIGSLGIEADGDDTIEEVLTTIVDRRVIRLIEPYIEYAPIVFAASLFFVMYIFSFLYRYLTRGFGLLWYGILRVSHFIFIKEVDVKAKRVSLEK